MAVSPIGKQEIRSEHLGSAVEEDPRAHDDAHISLSAGHPVKEYLINLSRP
jgi:hypothetical protein